jgi:PAS domain S-box-containing protein
MIETMRVLIARDQLCGRLLRPSTLQALESRGWTLELTLTDEAAIASLGTEAAEVCVLDRADAGSTIRFLAAIAGHGRVAPTVVLVAGDQAHLAEALITAGAADVLVDTDLDHSRFERALRNARDRARAGEALRASWGRFRALIENSAEGVIVLDAAGKVRYANDAVRQLVGYWSHELIGKYLFDFTHPEDALGAKLLFDTAARSSCQSVAGRFRVQHQAGHWRHVEWVMTGRLEDRDVRGVVLNCRDVTEEHRALKQMQRAARRLDQRQREWSALTAIVRALHPGEGDPRELLETIARVLSAAWSDDGHVGVRIVVGCWRGSTANLGNGACQHRVDFRLPDGQVGCLEIGSTDDGDHDASIRAEQQELMHAVSVMLQDHFSRTAQPSVVYRRDPFQSRADVPRQLRTA